jgi:hypothetical protein
MATIERFEDIEGWKLGRTFTSNIAEGFERGGDREFRQFHSTAKGSVGELRSQHYAALDAQYISKSEFDELYPVCLKTSKSIAGLMRYLAQSDLDGNKYRHDQVRAASVADLAL